MSVFPIIVVSALAMLVGMAVFAYLAPKIGLLDNPDDVRKWHVGAIPLAGGPALLTALLTVYLVFAEAQPTHWTVFALVSIVTVVLGAIDDRIEMSAHSRLVVQLALGGAAVFAGGVMVTHFGDLVGNGSQLPLSWLAPWITIGALAAAMNAFNMLDGTDGQAATLAWIPAAAITVSALAAGVVPPLFVLVLLGALPVFLLFNLKSAGRIPKCFLGDSGALLLGLLAGWMLIHAAQAPNGWLAPATVLWFAAIPLFDTLFVMSYRMLQRRSPFSPDRNHIHHLLRDHGFGQLDALGVVASVAVLLSAVGLALQWNDAPEALSFGLLFALFFGYIIGASALHRSRPRELRQPLTASS